MKAQLEKIYADATNDIEKVVNIKELEEVKAKYLSRKGEFNEIKKGLKDLSPEDKRIVGSLANEITQKLENAIKSIIAASENINTIFSLDVICKLEDGGYNPAKEILDKAGVYVRPNGKTNVNLGKPKYNF